MNWDDPAARARHIERVGIAQYNRDFQKHLAATTVVTVNGYPIRPVQTRFGRLFMVQGTATAFAILSEAEDFARKQPAKS